ncbi:hypothetical protein KBT16_31465 [Nostoc sp. CCCryo 231-06]|nr:hypothetical protein [Nostoc sp. CCCryo 231-06]
MVADIRQKRQRQTRYTYSWRLQPANLFWGEFMRVTIRQSLHPFISNKAQELGINDHAEVVNFLLLQILQNSMLAQATATGSQDTQ